MDLGIMSTDTDSTKRTIVNYPFLCYDISITPSERLHPDGVYIPLDERYYNHLGYLIDYLFDLSITHKAVYTILKGWVIGVRDNCTAYYDRLVFDIFPVGNSLRIDTIDGNHEIETDNIDSITNRDVANKKLRNTSKIICKVLDKCRKSIKTCYRPLNYSIVYSAYVLSGLQLSEFARTGLKTVATYQNKLVHDRVSPPRIVPTLDEKRAEIEKRYKEMGLY